MIESRNEGRYLKTAVGDEVVHIILAPRDTGLTGFAEFVTDLADAERTGGTVLVDVTGLSLVDGRLLDGIARAARRIRMRGDRFGLVCSDARVLQLFNLAGHGSTAVVYNSVPEALLAISKPEDA